MSEPRTPHDAETFEQREAMALRSLEIARTWSRKIPRRPRPDDVEVDALPDREAHERTVGSEDRKSVV
jgi:hypothetical protein